MFTVPLEKLLSASVDSLFYFVVVDANGHIRHIGRTYAEILGFPYNEIIGKPIQEIIPNTGLLRVLRTGKEEIGQFFILKNGKPALCNRYPIRDENGILIGAISSSIIHDTDRISQLDIKVKLLKQENEQYQRQLEAIIPEPFQVDSIIGNSPTMSIIKDNLQKIANTNLGLLFTGETGTGKEVFANAVHRLSNRRYENFVKVNCAAIPQDLMESELFGYAEGAFSGASRKGKAGKFEQANNGTILLDEIAELPLSLQAKLLRVLQENEVERLGSNKTVPLNIRLICCTNQNLEEMVRQNRFRQDLYYRINTIDINIPPLRERKEDIAPLCEYFMEKINKDHGCYIEGIADSMVHQFSRYSWPGNVRELEHVLERACVLTISGILDESHFDFFLPRLYRTESPSPLLPSLSDTTAAVEKKAIAHVLESVKGNKSKAAGVLHISRTQLYEKLRKYEML